VIDIGLSPVRGTFGTDPVISNCYQDPLKSRPIIVPFCLTVATEARGGPSRYQARAAAAGRLLLRG
jgi:hypothetical protein